MLGTVSLHIIGNVSSTLFSFLIVQHRYCVIRQFVVVPKNVCAKFALLYLIGFIHMQRNIFLTYEAYIIQICLTQL